MKYTNLVIAVLASVLCALSCKNKDATTGQEACQDSICHYCQTDFFSVQCPEELSVLSKSSTDSCCEVVFKHKDTDKYSISVQVAQEDIFGGTLDNFLGPICEKEWADLEANGETCNLGFYHGSCFTTAKGYECYRLWNCVTCKGDTISQSRVYFKDKYHVLITEKESFSLDDIRIRIDLFSDIINSIEFKEGTINSH